MSAAAAKSVSKSRDILKDVNTADVIEKDTPKVPVHVKLNKTKKRKEKFEDCQSRKKQKKDDVRAANCTPGKGSDFLSSNKVVKDGSEAAADVELKTMSGKFSKVNCS